MGLQKHRKAERGTVTAKIISARDWIVYGICQ